MAGELVVDVIKSGSSTPGAPGDITIDGNTTHTGSVKGDLTIEGNLNVEGNIYSGSGIIKPFSWIKKITITPSEISNTKYSNDGIIIDGLQGTGAKFLLASVFANSNYSGNDWVNFCFGYDIPLPDNNFFDNDYFNESENLEDSMRYVVFTNDVGNGHCHRGFHQFFIIPLGIVNGNPYLDFRAYDVPDSIVYVKIRAIGYVE